MENSEQREAEGDMIERSTAAEPVEEPVGEAIVYEDEEEAEPKPLVLVNGNSDGELVDNGTGNAKGNWDKLDYLFN